MVAVPAYALSTLLRFCDPSEAARKLSVVGWSIKTHLYCRATSVQSTGSSCANTTLVSGALLFKLASCLNTIDQTQRAFAQAHSSLSATRAPRAKVSSRNEREFSEFIFLPKDIREQVWTCAAGDEEVVIMGAVQPTAYDEDIKQYDLRESYSDPFSLIARRCCDIFMRTRRTALWYVCHEARHFIRELPKYPWTFSEHSGSLINLTKDIFWFPDTNEEMLDFIDHFECRLGPASVKYRRLAMPARFWVEYGFGYFERIRSQVEVGALEELILVPDSFEFPREPFTIHITNHPALDVGDWYNSIESCDPSMRSHSHDWTNLAQEWKSILELRMASDQQEMGIHGNYNGKYWRTPRIAFKGIRFVIDSANV